MEKISRLESKYLKKIVELNKYLFTNPGLRRLLNKIIDCLLDLTNTQRGLIMLSAMPGKLKFEASKNINPRQVASKSFIVSGKIINEVAKTGRPIVFNSIPSRMKFGSKYEVKLAGIKSLFCLPLVYHKELLGIVYLDSSAAQRKYTKREKEILYSFLSFAVLAINNVRLYESSIKDPLTDLYNINYLFLRLQEECLKAQRYQEQTSLLLIDINDFEHINEVFGHKKGDELLRNFSVLLRGIFREYDLIFRYEADKFVVLLPSASLKEAENITRRIKKKVQSEAFILDGEKVHLDISIGLTGISPPLLDSEKLIEELEKLVVLAKSKDKISISTPPKYPEGIEKFIGESEASNKIRTLIQRFARVRASVLLFGETGTGKDLVARMIHELSPCKEKPFMAIECAALPETLLESELFGYERGAFTGAYKFKKGLIELAAGGTLYLDNVDNLPLSLQAKILRAVEERKFLRLGGEREIGVDVRIIASTIKDLGKEVKKGSFRPDLYQRLNLLTISLPLLKERKEDILVIAEYFLKNIAKTYKKFVQFSREAKRSLIAYDWPGNVRELRYRIERAVIWNRSGIVEPDDMDIALRPRALNLRENYEKLELNLIKESLKFHKGNISLAAKELGVSRTTFYNLLEKFNLSCSKFEH